MSSPSRESINSAALKFLYSIGVFLLNVELMVIFFLPFPPERKEGEELEFDEEGRNP